MSDSVFESTRLRIEEMKCRGASKAARIVRITIRRLQLRLARKETARLPEATLASHIAATILGSAAYRSTPGFFAYAPELKIIWRSGTAEGAISEMAKPCSKHLTGIKPYIA